MILTVLLRSRSALKALGSVIDAAVSRGHDVGLDVQASAKEPWQPGDLGRWPELPRRRAGVTIGLSTYPDADVGVPHWWDNIFAPPHEDQRVIGYLSEWHKTQHARNFPIYRRHIQRQPIVGWTIADHRRLLGGRGRPAHVLFAMKRIDPSRRSLTWRLRYFDTVRWAAKDAAAHDHRFVIKTRPKHRDPWWLSHYGPVVGEMNLYPSTSLMLLRDAWAVTTFSSGAFLEARLFPGSQITNHAAPLGALDLLPGARASYEHMWNDPLDRVITYTDVKAGERIVDLAEGL